MVLFLLPLWAQRPFGKRIWRYFLYFFASCHLIYCIFLILFLIWKDASKYLTSDGDFLSVGITVQKHVLKGKSTKDLKELEDELKKLHWSVHWWTLMSAFIIYALYRKSKLSLELLFHLSSFRLIFTTLFWTTVCFIGYGFNHCMGIRCVNLVLEHRYQRNQCKDFDMSWILSGVNLIPTNTDFVSKLLPSSLEPMFNYYTILMSKHLFFGIRFSDTFSCVLWGYLFQLSCNRD